MKIGNWSATTALNAIYREIRDNGLEANLAELEAYGFTVVEGAFDPATVVELRTRIIEIAEEANDRKFDLEGQKDGATPEGSPSDVALIHYLLYKDPIFKKAVVNDKSLPLITYLLGEQCVLSSLTCHLKGPGGPGLALHSDNGFGLPEPFPPYAMVANCNYALTDYTKEGGCFAVVPGSHRMSRRPLGREQTIVEADRFEHVIPVEVPAGSAIIWHGNTWHGSYPREIPGLRINLSTFYCRESLRPQEDYVGNAPDGFLDHASEATLSRLLGSELPYSWKDEGPVKLYQRFMSKGIPNLPTWYV